MIVRILRVAVPLMARSFSKSHLTMSFESLYT